MTQPPIYYSHPNIKIEEHLQAVRDLMIEQWNQIPVKPELISKNNKLFEYIIGLIAIFHDFGKFNAYFQKYLSDPDQYNKKKYPESHHALLSAITYAEFVEYTKPTIINYLKTTMADPADTPYIEPLYNILKLLGYEIILRHHGNLKDIEWETNDERNEHTEPFAHIGKQIQTINKPNQGITHILTQLLPAFQNAPQNPFTNNSFSLLDHLNSNQDSTKVRTFIKTKIRPAYIKFKNLNTQQPNEDSFILLTFILFQTIFSILIDSDKKIAHNINYNRNIRNQIPDTLIETYKTTKFGQSPNIQTQPPAKTAPASLIPINSTPNLQNQPNTPTMNQLREEFFITVIQNLQNTNLDTHRIFSITAPTGIGKTLTALATAIKLRNTIQQQKKYTPRIIYCLPFTSIIDQNHQIIDEILTQIPNYPQNQSQYLLKHHHLSDLYYKEENQYLPNQTATMLIESWESEIIVTTFVQLFKTMFGYQNRALKKFTKLLGSIIILDEIQAIPPKYWRLFQKVTEFLATNFGTYILFLTATKPAIYDQNQFLELGNPNYFFSKFDRITLQFKKDISTIPKITEFILSELQQQKSPSFIIILNTIRCSIDTYNHITQTFDSNNILYKKYSDISHASNSINQTVSDNSAENFDISFPSAQAIEQALSNILSDIPILLYLSTNLIPTHRKKIIETIKILNKTHRPFILVCTQLIEAGVDITANYVIRDIAPLDSIIQSAGRCNRNNSDKQQGKVIVTNISSPKRYAETIYSPVLIQKTIEILEQTTPLNNNTQNLQSHTTHTQLIRESDFRTMTEKYFQDIRNNNEYTQKFEIILKELKFSPPEKPKPETKYLSQIELIEEKYKIDYFIELDNHAKQLKNQTQTLITQLTQNQNLPQNNQNQFNYYKTISELKSLKKKLNEYTVQSFEQPPKTASYDPDLEVYYIPHSFYDKDLGLQLP